LRIRTLPLLIFHILEGRSQQEIGALLDATHRVVLDTFHVPQRDRYQIVHEHKPSHVRFEDTGLGIPRSDKFELLQVVTRPHSTEAKTAFYKNLCDQLQRSCGIAPSDVMVSIVGNTDEDWSFGLGRAQFLTGELGGSKAEVARSSSSTRPAPSNAAAAQFE
jgi:Tautomerase enzyme